MIDWSYADAFARRWPGDPALVPPSDQLWRRIFGEHVATQRLTRAWVAGHLRLLRRWHVDGPLGAFPTTFEHRGDRVVIEVAGIEVGSVSVDELLDGG